MSTVRSSGPDSIGPPAHPTLLAIAYDLLHTARIAAEKAIAHADDPATYPMPPGGNSLEHLMLDRFRHLPPEKRRRAIDRVRPIVESPRHDRYGELAEIDLTSAVPVLDQADAIVARRGVPKGVTSCID